MKGRKVIKSSIIIIKQKYLTRSFNDGLDVRDVLLVDDDFNPFRRISDQLLKLFVDLPTDLGSQVFKGNLTPQSHQGKFWRTGCWVGQLLTEAMAFPRKISEDLSCLATPSFFVSLPRVETSHRCRPFRRKRRLGGTGPTVACTVSVAASVCNMQQHVETTLKNEQNHEHNSIIVNQNFYLILLHKFATIGCRLRANDEMRISNVDPIVRF